MKAARSVPAAHRLRAAHYRTGEVWAFTFRGDRLVERARARGEAELIFGPGFCDLQCNGFAGVDFNHPQTVPEAIAGAVRAMWRHGCTLVLPTIVTQHPERLEMLFRKLVAAVADDPETRRSVPGFHLEGPFISPEDGARGAHLLDAVRPPDVKLWRRVQRAAEGGIRLVTLAPELPGALPLLRLLRREAVLPAVGHTMSDAAQIRRAADAGALLSTHLGNGCPQQMHRHENPVFAQLGEDRLAASVIADGIHLPSDVVRTIARTKGAARTVLVTDAMAAAGAPPGRYTLSDLVLEVGRDHVVRQPGAPNFAGSALTMECAVANYAAMAGTTLADAWDAASTLPRALLQRAAGDEKTSASDTGTLFIKLQGAGLAVVATLRQRKVLWWDASRIHPGGSCVRQGGCCLQTCERGAALDKASGKINHPHGAIGRVLSVAHASDAEGA